jgi:1,4-dihydroxy-2-naphthoate octaprenyltransferase
MNENLRTLVLPRQDPQTERALRTGVTGGHRVVARKLLNETSGTPESLVVFEYLDSSAVRPRGIKPWLQAIRAFSLTATFTPCLAILMLLIYEREPFKLLEAITAALGVLGLQVAINVFNDIEDYRRLIDLPGTLGGSGMIQNGWWTPLELRTLAWSGLIFGGLLGVISVIREPMTLIPIAVLGAAGVLLYSAKQFGLKYIALGDLAVFVLCGPALTAGYALAISASVDSSVGSHGGAALWLGSFFGFLAMALLHVNNVQDMGLDQKRGVRTLAIQLGFRNSLRLLYALYALAALSLAGGVATHVLPAWVLAGLLPMMVVSLPWLRSLSHALGPESARLSHCRIKAAQIHLLSGLAVILGLAIGVGLEKLTA